MSQNWVKIFDQSIEQFWKVFTPLPAIDGDIILKIGYDVDWDEWEEHGSWYKSHGRLRAVYDTYNLLVSPSQSIYPKIEEEVRVIRTHPQLPIMKLSVFKVPYRHQKLINLDLLNWGVEIFQLQPD